MPLQPNEATFSSFTLVLAGGGARGFAHAGVLRALEFEGYRPGAIVGVSMGAVVGVTYALREDWYDALLKMDTRAFPGPLLVRAIQGASYSARLSTWLRKARVVHDLMFGWGPGTGAVGAGRRLLNDLTGKRALEESRIPVAVSTTDLLSGRRHVLRTGRATDALYASAALAGVLPPLRRDGLLLADGAYADIAPIDVAREFGSGVVIVVDPGQELAPTDIRNGYQALSRAVEICHLRHADARFAGADLVLRPVFRRTVDTLDFAARRLCVAAGIREVMRNRDVLTQLLGFARDDSSGQGSIHRDAYSASERTALVLPRNHPTDAEEQHGMVR